MDLYQLFICILVKIKLYFSFQVKQKHPLPLHGLQLQEKAAPPPNLDYLALYLFIIYKCLR